MYKVLLNVLWLGIICTNVFSEKVPTNVFIKNNGQIASVETNEPLNDVLYFLSTPSAKFYITKTGFIYLFQKNEYDSEQDELKTPKNTHWQRVDVVLKNANLLKIKEEKKVSWHYNYFFAHCPEGILNVPGFQELYFEEVYKGIDLKMYFDENKLKYDFIVKPYADFNQIQLEYKYTDAPKLQNNGDVIFTTSLGKIIETKPICFQDNRELANTRWIIKDNILSFDIPNHEKNKTLIIDPFLEWSTYFGGSVDDQAHGVAANDILNLVVVSGHTASSNLPVINPGGGAYFNGTYNGNTDIFIASFSTNGNLLWATYYGGTNIDQKGKPIIVNNTFIYLSAQTNSTDIPTHNPGGGAFFQSSLNNIATFDGFIIKFSLTGQLLWATYLGGSDQDEVSALANTANHLFAYSLTYSSDMTLINPGGGAWFQSVTNNLAHVHLARFNINNNAMTWGTYFGSPTVGTGWSWNSIACSGNKLYTAFNIENSSDAPLVNLAGSYFDNTYNGGTSDILISRFSENGVLEWSTYFGGNNIDEIRGITIANNKLWIAGHTNSTSNFPLFNPLNGAYYQGTFGGGASDGIIASFNLNGQLLWSTYYGGAGTEYIRDVKGDNFGVFIAGMCGAVFPVFNPGTPTFYDATTKSTFIAKFKQNGIRQWSSYFSGSWGDARKLSVTNNAVYMVGFVNSTLLTQDPGGGAYFDNTFNGGSSDAFIAKFDKCVIPQVSITVSQSAICRHDSTWLYGNGGISYLWSTMQTSDSIQVSPQNSASYSVTVTDDMTCTNTTSTYITVYPLPDVNITGDHPICLNDSITLYANGANTYQWFPTMQTSTSITVQPLITTTYYLLGTDVNNCKNIDSAQIIVYPLPNVQILGANPICFGDSIALQASGANTYVWTPGGSTSNSIVVSPQITTDYYLLGTDTNMCKNVDTATVVVYSLPNVQILGANPICFGDSITLTATGAISYLWLPDSLIGNVQNFSPSATSNYVVIGTDINQCKNSDTATVVVSPLPNVQIIGNHPICFGDSIVLAAINANSYIWSTSATGSSITLSPQQTTTYIVTGTDANGCKNSDTAVVIVNPLPQVNISGDHPICLYDSVTLIASGANTYIWQPWNYNTSQITVSPSTTTTVILTGTDINGCKNYDTTSIIVYPLPEIYVTGVQPICFGDSITITAHGAVNYNWQPSGLTGTTVTISPQTTQTYYVYGSDANNCKDTTSFSITVYELPVANISGINQICQQETVTLTASGGDQYIWSTGATSSNIEVSPMNTTTYSVIAIKNICSDTAYFTLVVDPKPILSITNDTTIIIGMSIQLNANGANSYIWTPSTYLSCFNCKNPIAKPSETIEYCVEGINNYGCRDTICVTITVDKECGETFIPSGFSPNNDGNNDVLYVRGKCIKKMQFTIFNRWGEKVFESIDPTIGWDGTFRGKLLETGVFVYYLTVEYYNGAIIKKHGNVTLIR